MFDDTLPDDFPETSPMPTMQPIHETLLILAKCHRNIQLNWEAVEKYQENSVLISQYHFTYNLSYYNLLETDIFLAKYEDMLASPDNDPTIFERAKVVKAILKPIYKRVRSFKGLHDFRNEIIAHPLRRKKQFVVPQNSVYSVPRS